MARVSIIVPLYNQWDYTARCLDALNAHTPPSFERVLIDNGSHDDTSTLHVQIRNDRNRGFAVACNQGAAYGSGDVLVFLNNDTEVHAGWLCLVDALDDPGVGISGARLLYPDGSVQHSGVAVDFTAPPGQEAWGMHDDAPTRDVTAVTGACLAIRRDLFLALGGFDEGFWNGYEDVDLCLRARSAGLTIRYVAESVVTHHESKSGPERWTRVGENVARLRAKWGTTAR